MSEDMVVVVPFHRLRRDRHVEYSMQEQPERLPSAPRALGVAWLLVLAHRMKEQIERGELRDLADAARRLGWTPARVTQVANLLLLAPQIQEDILLAKNVRGRDRVTERSLRPLLQCGSWAEQRRRWAELAPSQS